MKWMCVLYCKYRVIFIIRFEELQYLDLIIWVLLIKMCIRVLQMCYDQPIIIILENLLFIQDGEWGKKHNNAMKDVVWQCSILGKLKPKSEEEQKDAGCVNKWRIISLPEEDFSNRSKNNHHVNIETTIKCDNECHNQFVVFTGYVMTHSYLSGVVYSSYLSFEQTSKLNYYISAHNLVEHIRGFHTE